jgi:hypothetical protein
MRFHKGCPRPICDPCHLEHYGYYQTCWAPWPFPPDWSHCPVPPPGAVLPAPAIPPFTPRHRRSDPLERSTEDDGTEPGPTPLPSRKKPESELPPPKKMNDGPSVRLIQ